MTSHKLNKQIETFEEYQPRITDAPKVTFIKNSEHKEVDEATKIGLNNHYLNKKFEIGGGKTTAEYKSILNHYKHSLPKNTIMYCLIKRREAIELAKGDELI